jgi:hypothetical protein
VRVTLVQIDGLSLPALRRAMDAGRADTLRALAERGGWRLRPLYAGLPSTTPAVQAELFYGVRGRVPAFAYFDRDRAEAMHFMDPGAANRVERSIEDAGPALLAGGAGYCNIYVGGAAEARFSPAGLARTDEALSRPPRRMLRAVGAYAGVALRSVVMMGGELVRLTLGGPHTGGERLRVRLNDAWNRIVASVALRDMSRLGVLHAIARDLPVAQVNFVGYDKQAHRYGPMSRPAMRALSGIDGAIASLLDAGERDGRTLVIYADHGQEETEPIADRAGASIEAIVREAAHDAPLESHDDPDSAPSLADRARRAVAQLREEFGESIVGIRASGDDDPGSGPVTIQSGPIAHVYGLDDLDEPWRERIARRIAGRAPGVAVVWRSDEGDPRAALGDESLPDIDALCRHLVASHPFGDRIAGDLEALCRHDDAGDLVLLATGFTDRPVSFAGERGSHGGPGPVETCAFVLAPDSLDLPDEPRPIDLRSALLALRGGGS